VHEHPPRVVEALDAERLRAARVPHVELDLLGDGADLADVGAARDHEGVGDGEDAPDLQDHRVRAALVRRRPGGHDPEVLHLAQVKSFPTTTVTSTTSMGTRLSTRRPTPSSFCTRSATGCWLLS